MRRSHALNGNRAASVHLALFVLILLSTIACNSAGGLGSRTETNELDKPIGGTISLDDLAKALAPLTSLDQADFVDSITFEIEGGEQGDDLDGADGTIAVCDELDARLNGEGPRDCTILGDPAEALACALSELCELNDLTVRAVDAGCLGEGERADELRQDALDSIAERGCPPVRTAGVRTEAGRCVSAADCDDGETRRPHQTTLAKSLVSLQSIETPEMIRQEIAQLTNIYLSIITRAFGIMIDGEVKQKLVNRLATAGLVTGTGVNRRLNLGFSDDARAFWPDEVIHDFVKGSLQQGAEGAIGLPENFQAALVVKGEIYEQAARLARLGNNFSGNSNTPPADPAFLDVMADGWFDCARLYGEAQDLIAAPNCDNVEFVASNPGIPEEEEGPVTGPDPCRFEIECPPIVFIQYHFVDEDFCPEGVIDVCRTRTDTDPAKCVCTLPCYVLVTGSTCAIITD